MITNKKLPRCFLFFMAVEGGGEIKVSTNIVGWKIHRMLIIFARKDGDFPWLRLAEGIVSQYILLPSANCITEVVERLVLKF